MRGTRGGIYSSSLSALAPSLRDTCADKLGFHVHVMGEDYVDGRHACEQEGLMELIVAITLRILKINRMLFNGKDGTYYIAQ